MSLLDWFRIDDYPTRTSPMAHEQALRRAQVEAASQAESAVIVSEARIVTPEPRLANPPALREQWS